jgi:hypothetical protein
MQSSSAYQQLSCSDIIKRARNLELAARLPKTSLVNRAETCLTVMAGAEVQLLADSCAIRNAVNL